ncbi:hypothetical protein [Streptomyces sp. NPDC058683]
MPGWTPPRVLAPERLNGLTATISSVEGSNAKYDVQVDTKPMS